MIGTVFLILLLVFLFFVMLISFLARRHPVGFGVLVVSGISIAFILITNLDFLLSLKTKKEVYKVVDEETQKPVPNACVVIGWAVHYATIASSPRCYYKVVRTVSNANGEFVVPPALKPVNIAILGFYRQNFSGIDLGIYDTGYKYFFKEVHADSDSEKIISLMQNKTSSQLLKSVITTYGYLERSSIDCKVGATFSPDDVSFFKNSYYKLDELFSDEFTDNFEDAYKLVDVEHRLKQPEAYILLKRLLHKHVNLRDKDYYDIQLRAFGKYYMHEGVTK